MPGTAPPIPTKRSRRPTACSQDRPHDPYFLELKGQILLESGRPQEALGSLREAVARAPDQPLIAALFGHALIATEDPDNFEEAKRVLARRRRSATTTIPSPGISSASSTTARATRRAPRSPPPNATT